MKNKRNMDAEVNALFKDLGMEKEMGKLMELYTDQFMVQGAVTEDLKEALRRASDSLLNMIWDEIADKEKAGEIDRNEKEEILFQDIQENFREQLIYIAPLELELLLDVMNQKAIELTETVMITDEFIPKGWVFGFTENNNCIFVVPEEIRQIIMSLKEEEVENKMAPVYGARYLLNTCLGLYGVFQWEQVETVFEKVIEEKKAGTESLDFIRELLPVFEEQGLLWMDGDYMISPFLKTEEEYRELLKGQKGKDYYIPDADLIRAYAMGKTLEKNAEYQEVHKCLTKELRDSRMAENMLAEISGYIVRENWGVPQVMNSLYHFGVAFDSRKSAKCLTGALSKWIYHVRRWSECGYSRKERGLENEDLQYAANMRRDDSYRKNSVKIYPNDPCPCGSGKKYKKCCGR